MRYFRYFSLFLSPLALFCACVKELPDIPEPEVTETVPFSITVQQEPQTRASFDGSAIGAGNYVFSDGDKLYITGGEGNISGELTIASGAGSRNATFSGDLVVANNYSPTASTSLSATLVGASQVGSFFTITDHIITAGPTYPISIEYTSSLAELVQKYSHFTAVFTYNARQITLTQQTVFLNFDLELYRSSLTLSGESPTVQVDIKRSDGSSVLRSVTGVPVGGNSTIARIQFAAVSPAGISLQNAQTWIENGSDDVHCEPDFAANLDLSANHYYHVLRSAIEEFTVEAPTNGQGASVSFNYGYATVQFRKYTGGSWSDWEAYSSTIPLSAGEKVSFRGQGSSYANTGGSIPTGNDSYTINSGTPLITVTNSVYIYGDIMSLVCDANWVRQSTVEANAFKFAFSGCTNINIPTDKNLVLSAETLGNSCYEGMFSGCTSLTKAPILAATTSVPQRAYYGMFQGCSNLATPPASLPATTLGDQAYCQMFANCVKLASAPEFPSTKGTFSGKQICYRMFAKCKMTAVTGQLFTSDTELVEECYHGMFRHCTSLATVPEGYLPSLTLAKWCYRGMFEEAAFSTAPTLPAPELVTECYRYMFYKCANLSYIKCLATNPSNVNSTNNPYTPNFTTNVATSGTFVTNDSFNNNCNWSRGAHGIPSGSGWTIKTLSEEQQEQG